MALKGGHLRLNLQLTSAVQPFGETELAHCSHARMRPRLNIKYKCRQMEGRR